MDRKNFILKSISNSAAQERRFDRAMEADCSPDKIDSEMQTAIFSGSGKKPYVVTLESCSCVDFARNGGLPCKHIYRLAMELGIIDCEFEKGINKNRAKMLVESGLANLSEDAKRIFMWFLNVFSRKGETCFLVRRGKDSESLVTNGFCEEFSGAYRDFASGVHRGLLIHEINQAGILDEELKSGAQLKRVVSLIAKAEDDGSCILNERFIALSLSQLSIRQEKSIYRKLCSLFYGAGDDKKLKRLNDFYAVGLMTKREYETNLMYLEAVEEEEEWEEEDGDDSDCVIALNEVIDPLLMKEIEGVLGEMRSSEAKGEQMKAVSSNSIPVSAVQKKTEMNVYCVWAFISAIIGLPLMPLGVFSILAVVLGIVGLRKAKGLNQRGKGLAIAALIIGGISSLLFLVVMVGAVLLD